MPKENVKTIKIKDKALFIDIVHSKGSSINKLGSIYSIQASEKTLRRQLSHGQMRPHYLDAIAKYLDVDPRLLSGELEDCDRYPNSYFLKHLEDYPYLRKKFDDLRGENLSESIFRILALFNRSLNQYDALDFDSQISFQKELLNAIFPVVTKHFKSQAFGNNNVLEDQYIFIALEEYIEEHQEYEFANTTLRQRYLEKVPKGYTKIQINKMTPDELLTLDRELQWQNWQ